MLLLSLLWALSLAGGSADARADRVVEIRSYNLKPGTLETFERLFHERALPLLGKSGIDVVAFGRSLHDDNSWYLLRSFADVVRREESEDAFYGSDEWRQGPRQEILDCIDSYTTIVVSMDDDTISGLRRSSLQQSP